MFKGNKGGSNSQKELQVEIVFYVNAKVLILYFGTTVSITAMGEEAVSPEKTIKKALIGTVILSYIRQELFLYFMPL